MSKIEEDSQLEEGPYHAPHLVGLSEEHREFLLARHGTVELDPMPAMSDLDPLNWSKGKKTINIVLVAFHAMMATFTASAIQSAFVNIAEDLHVSVQRTSYLTSLVIAILGGAPLFWRPVSQAYGRRPVFLLSLICSAVCNVGCGLCHSYGTMATCRALTAFFISPASSIGSGVVTEMFFKNQRARYMGVWTTMVTLGVPIAPFLFGFMVLRVGYRWIYWVMAITNGVQFVLYFFLGDETRFVPETAAEEPTTYMARRLWVRRIDPTPLKPVDFIQPLLLARFPCISIPAAAYAMVFLWGSILLTIEIPELYPVMFGFNSQQVGLQFLAIIVGTILGEQVGGVLSDQWMRRRRRRLGGKDAEPEYRLWLSYSGYLLTICGVVVFLVQTDRAGTSWNMSPVIGIALAAAGNQLVTTVLITYAVDCYRAEAPGVGVYITFVRQTWGFIGPFWFPHMIEEVGLRSSAGIISALIIVVSILPTILLQWKGHSWR